MPGDNTSVLRHVPGRMAEDHLMSYVRACARRNRAEFDELDASRCLPGRFVTGWFSPADHEILVMFYERGSPIHFQAEVLRCGELVNRFQDDNLARLQSDVSRRFGGNIESPQWKNAASRESFVSGVTTWPKKLRKRLLQSRRLLCLRSMFAGTSSREDSSIGSRKDE